MKFNVASWSSYAEEYNKNAIFSENVIHTGLGLPGIYPTHILSIPMAELQALILL